MKKQGSIILGIGGDKYVWNRSRAAPTPRAAPPHQRPPPPQSHTPLSHLASSNRAVGTWYEGAITAGYTSDATDDAVAANVAAAGFGK
jgi:hypothetical protein